MESTVYSFLADIVNNEVHPPILVGPNNYKIEIRYDTNHRDSFIYYGAKNRLCCYQDGHEILIYHIFSLSSWRVDLADPNSRETIANIFKTN